LFVPGVETAADPTNISELLVVFSHIAEARFIWFFWCQVVCMIFLYKS